LTTTFSFLVIDYYEEKHQIEVGGKEGIPLILAG